MKSNDIAVGEVTGGADLEVRSTSKARAGAVRGVQSRLACKCSRKNDVDFLVREDRIVCACCGREVYCTPPIKGIFNATCSCCANPGVKSTFVLDSAGAYVCTWCGAVR